MLTGEERPQCIALPRASNAVKTALQVLVNIPAFKGIIQIYGTLLVSVALAAFTP